MNKAFLAMVGTTALVGTVTLLSSVYTVGEGNVGVVTKFGRAIGVTEPGLHFKMPFIQGVEEVEVRERRLAIDALTASTREELPVTVAFSINWALDRSEVLETYRQYGGLEQFESRVLRPVISQAAKSGIARYSASELIKDRGAAVQATFTEIQNATERLPLSVNVPNFEDIQLPESYRDAVLRKEQARQDAEAEQQKLNQQKLIAQRDVQTAQAAGEARKATADADSYAAQKKADADAYAAEKKADADLYAAQKRAAANLALAQAEAAGTEQMAQAITSDVVEYERVKRWDGAQPRMVFGNAGPLLTMPLDVAP